MYIPLMYVIRMTSTELFERLAYLRSSVDHFGDPLSLVIACDIRSSRAILSLGCMRVLKALYRCCYDEKINNDVAIGHYRL